MDDALLHLLNTGSFTGIAGYLAYQWFKQRRNGNPNGLNGLAKKVSSDLETARAESTRRFETIHKRLDNLTEKQADIGERLSKIEGQMGGVLDHVRHHR